ncbi:MAG: TIGR04255 family protein [Deltaproteobacteria bacterium]|nr:TIGR04255 family protein [Deltaproteobacteria bacterium]
MVEVALGVQFEPLGGLGIPLMAQFWEQIRDRFPKWTQHPLIPAAMESFGSPMAVPLNVSFSLRNDPMIRSMFEDIAGNHLIQVQNDRFVHNWKKEQDQSLVYPRYPVVRKNFEAAFQHFAKFAGEHGLGEPVATLCEVAYVNHVPASKVWGRYGQLGEVLASFSGHTTDGFLAEPEGVDLNLRYVIPDLDGRPVGRLHVAARPVIRRVDGTPMFKLDLTARTLVEDRGLTGALGALDKGHDFLVNAFRSITTKKMHEVWGLE